MIESFGMRTPGGFTPVARVPRLAASLLMVEVAVLVSSGPLPSRHAAAQGTVVPMQPSDSLRATTLGSATSVIAYAARYGASRPVDDLSATTVWESAVTSPAAAMTQFGLGASVPIGLLRWLHRETGYADALTIETSTDGVAWSTLLQAGNAPSLQWQGIIAGRTARFVRSPYADPNRDTKIGSLAQIQFFPSRTAGWPFVTWTVPGPPDPVLPPDPPAPHPTLPPGTTQSPVAATAPPAGTIR